MFLGLSHLDLAVSRLDRARAFYVDGLGFAVKAQGDGYCDVDGITVCLRLIEVARVEHRCALRLQVSDVAAAHQHLLRLGARELYAPHRSPQLELVASCRDADGHSVSVWRPLSEDEWEFVPELPTTMRWHGEAEVLLKALLLRVPALFRGLARRKVSSLAEELASDRPVGREDVIRAYIRSSARITRDRVKKPLLDNGIDPALYAEDFEW